MPSPLPAPLSFADVVVDQATRRPGARFVEDARSDRYVTYAALADGVAAWSVVLARCGVGRGSAVVLDVEDPVTCAVVLVALLAAGRVAVPVDPGAPTSELAPVVTSVGARLHVTDRPAARTFDGVPTVAVDPTDARAGEPTVAAACDPVLDGAGVVLPTSGSTGRPKLVPLIESGLLHVGAGIAHHNRLAPSDRGYNPLPLFHVNAEVVGVVATLVAGATLVLDRRFHRTGFWELLEQRRITWLNAVPAVLGILAADDAPGRPTRLRFMRSASAALPERARAWATAPGRPDLVESYGMTEAGSQITATPLGGGAPAGSVGRPVGTELQIRDGSGGPAGVDVVGRVWIRGPGVVTRYLHDQAAERFDADGWLDTSDLGRVDVDGWVFLVGRADDVINRGGELLHPREIEDVLRGDPRVADAVVIARPDPILGEVPVALVLAGPGQDDDGSLRTALLDRCMLQLTRYKRPVDIAMVEEFPRAATGKILRAQVRWP